MPSILLAKSLGHLSFGGAIDLAQWSVGLTVTGTPFRGGVARVELAAHVLCVQAWLAWNASPA